MMDHNLIFKEETETDVMFECANCHCVLGLNKPGIGLPCAVQKEKGNWQPPDDWKAYMPACIDLNRDLAKAEAEVVEIKAKILELEK